jgi:hypothetical protein
VSSLQRAGLVLLALWAVTLPIGFVLFRSRDFYVAPAISGALSVLGIACILIGARRRSA